MTQREEMKEYDLLYHITPPRGLLNDPNGLIKFKGVYHVFYQWNRSETSHRDKSWGHVTSTDLIHWENQPSALEPTDWFDKDGCYSGSAVSVKDVLYLFYTGNVRTESGERESYQCLAVSKDGIHFEKKGPIIEQPEGYTAHVRDPKVWQDQHQTWWMILGAQKLDLTGDTIVYRSQNLQDWAFAGSLTTEMQDFGYMWECPDLLFFEEKAVFIFSPQGLEPEGDAFQNLYQTGYVSGSFSKEGKLILDDKPFRELDKGFEFYAPQSFEDEDGRRILFGWMGVMEPEVEAAVPTVSEGWLHALTIPREVAYDNGRLKQRPVNELQALREGTPLIIKNEELQCQNQWTLPSLQSEIWVQWGMPADDFKLIIRKDVQLTYDAGSRKISLCRKNWYTNEKEERSVRLESELSSIQLFLENSSLEVFINDGEEVFSLRYFTSKQEKNLFFESANAANLPTITIYSLYKC